MWKFSDVNQMQNTAEKPNKHAQQQVATVPHHLLFT